jgi:hypothetical protein
MRAAFLGPLATSLNSALFRKYYAGSGGNASNLYAGGAGF